MDSLYKITDDLRSIFNEIELAEGEMTPEIAEELTIKQNELIEKLTNYKNAVLGWKADVDAVSCESKRLSSRKKTLENRIAVLKDRMLDAVKEFGCEGKTNKFIELPDARIFTRKSNAVAIDEERCDVLINCIREVIKSGEISGYVSDIDLLEKINGFASSIFNYEKEQYFTIDDIKSISISVSKITTGYDLLHRDNPLMLAIYSDKCIPSLYEMTCNNSKSSFVGFTGITIAKQIENESIQIK